MTLSPGTRLGRYEIRHKLGSGGMGEVYLAWDPELEREVAIKVLRADNDESPERTRRFVQEAKAASAFSHPNVAHVYEIGTAGDLRYIAMEVVQGETLRQRIGRGEIPVDDVINIGSQVAAALAAAHGSGIVHRDMKPENVIVRPDGYVKVLDFGLAKLVRRDSEAATLLKTRPGAVMGTPRYMAPEQFGGSDVTPPADVFSLGVVLYEMLTGRRPFDGDDNTALARAILSEDPVPPTKLRDAIPPRLCEILTKALQKDPGLRYPTAAELLEDLKLVSRESTAAAFESLQAEAAAPRKRRLAIIAAALAAVIVIGAAAVAFHRSARVREAREAIDEAERLVAEFRWLDAWEVASRAASALPDDPRLLTIRSAISARVTFDSDPPGSTVYLERFGDSAGRVAAGTTPFTIEHVPAADYIVTFEKSGYEPAYRTLPLAPRVTINLAIPPGASTLSVRLLESTEDNDGMVLVEGGTYRLAGWSRPSDRAVELEDFLIDRHEVSNRDFEAFVRDGGYRRVEFWQHPFELDGRILSFDEAMARLRDTTGLPSPRFWIGGAPPPGKEDHPVVGVTWYEAAAFAAWKGKTLPTVYQWEKAARFVLPTALGSAMPWGDLREGTDVTQRANFLGRGTMAVDSMPFGLSPWGALHMAGNVAEWCLNPSPPGHAVRGGSWNDAIYQFGQTASLPGFFASDQVGFRCVSVSGSGSDQGSFPLDGEMTIPEYRPVDDAAFAEIRARYEYAPSPLQSRVVESIETTSWTREKIEYEVGGTTVPAYLYLPKGYSQPFQVIHFSPAGDVAAGYRELTASIEVLLAPQIREGRAVFSVVMEGFLGRPRTQTRPDSRSPEYADFAVRHVTELRRGLDYLETRQDIDAGRIAFVAPSAGAVAGVILAGVESRYRSVMFIGTRLIPQEVGDVPAANRINFVPRIKAPTIMLQGRYDETAPLVTHAEPLFHLLRAPARLEVYEGSHMPPTEVLIPTVSRWLDETLGPVASTR
jgi:eukaryotic-like serine/threonine-protein kinase